jgi:hypothetical protein
MAIGVFAATGSAGGPNIYPLVFQAFKMMQEPFQWWDPKHGADAIQSAELEHIAGIQRYLEVDGDDPTRIVDGYLNAWWHGEVLDQNLESYIFGPHEHLAVHRPQVSHICLGLHSF